LRTQEQSRFRSRKQPNLRGSGLDRSEVQLRLVQGSDLGTGSTYVKPLHGPPAYSVDKKSPA
jgi:hypothetical protein